MLIISSNQVVTCTCLDVDPTWHSRSARSNTNPKNGYTRYSASATLSIAFFTPIQISVGGLALLPEVSAWFQDDLRFTLPTNSGDGEAILDCACHVHRVV
jgi:hypothetical protein